MPRGHHSLLWTKATSFMKLKGGYLWQEGAIVHCDQSPQHLNGHSGYNSGQLVHLTYYWVNWLEPILNNQPSFIFNHWWIYFIIYLKVTYVPRAHNSSLWTKATSFVKLKGGYLQPDDIIFHCYQFQQHLNGHMQGNEVKLLSVFINNSNRKFREHFWSQF